MNPQIDIGLLEQAAAQLDRRWPGAQPRCGIVLGSGWGASVAGLKGDQIPYSELPGLGTTGVDGHAGMLLLSEIAGMEVLVFKGRRHWYEGAGWTPVVQPVYLMQALGVGILLLTNAAGGIRDDLPPGSLMAIKDHINQLGSNPLIGSHHPALGPRFPDQTAIYDAGLRQGLLRSGADAEGVYLATSGPTFETPAEIRQYRAIGADAVGMSTVPEAIVANALGMKVAGLSCICNWAAGLGHAKLTHEDVNRTAAETMPRMRATIATFLEELAHGAR